MDQDILKKGYKLLVYALIVLIGVVLLYFSGDLSITYWSDLTLNLGTEFLGGALIFIVLQFFLIDRLDKDKVEYEKFVEETLDRLGISAKDSERYACAFELINRDRMRQHAMHSESDINKIIKNYSYSLGEEKEVGPYDKTKISNYVGLTDISCSIDDLRVLSEVMYHYLLDCCNAKPGNPICFDKVATWKGGNPALALLVSIAFKKPLVFIDTTENFIFSSSVNGKIEAGERIIFLHDVAASGKVLVRCINEVRKARGIIEHAFVLIERTDRAGDSQITPSELLRQNDIELHSFMSTDDTKLAKILTASPN